MTESRRAQEDSESRSLEIFFASAVLAVVLCISAGFLGVAFKNRQLIKDEILHRARLDFQNVMVMRHWNAGYGGVYVEKKAGIVSNPYLENPDITATDGRVFTKKNPALMTRELSELIDRNQGYTFHITSLRPINPHNQPDPKETEALRAFEAGASERYWTEDRNGGSHFRYMAPLKVEESCLACHARQGYKVGEIRGGISVSFRISELQQNLRRNMGLVIGLAALTILLLVGIVTILFRNLVTRLHEAREELRRQAATDTLTGLLNRRSVLLRLEEELERHRRSGKPLCCCLLDVDYFKQVNDTLGHLAGDQALVSLAQTLRAASRLYDVTGRYGGEEFIIILPETSLDDSSKVLERVREALESSVRAEDGRAVTASFGLACWRPDETMSDLLSRADKALYLAKTLGRNRVEKEPRDR